MTRALRCGDDRVTTLWADFAAGWRTRGGNTRGMNAELSAAAAVIGGLRSQLGRLMTRRVVGARAPSPA